MKKVFFRRTVSLLVCSCLISWNAELGDSSAVEQYEACGALWSKYTHTQRSAAQWSGYGAYRRFLSTADKKFVIPGLNEGFVPQGITFCEKENSFMISGYNACGGAAYILTVDAKSGRINGEYKIVKGDGTDFTGHSGGIASFGRYVYITDGYILYYIPSAVFTGGSKEVKIGGEIRLPAYASFISAFDGYLWAGNFYHKSLSGGYDVCACDGYGKLYRTLIAGYRFDFDCEGALRTSTFGDISTAIAYAAVFAPDEVQGIAFLGNGDMHLSCSYGREVMSQQLLYSYPLKRSCDTVVTLGKNQIPAWFLNNDSLKRSLVVPPMSEGVVARNGMVYVIFESASDKYRETALDPTDSAWEIKW